MPRRIYTYAPDLGWNFWNMVSTMGSLLIARVGPGLHRQRGEDHARGHAAGPDPWDGRTLEWTIPSPPPVYNFAVVPTAHERDSFWVQKYGDGHGGKPSAPTRPATAQDIASIHIPSPSYWPLVLAISIALMIAGLIISMVQVAVFGVLTIVCMYCFAMELHRPAAGHGH